MASITSTRQKSTKESTGVGLSTSYYMNKFYGTNRNAGKASKRKDFANCELVYEDSKALQKAAKYLSRHKYSEEDIKENVYSSILAFKDTYNNAMDSLKDLDNTQAQKYMKKLNTLLQDHEDVLKDAGITIDQKTKKININSNLLKNADMENLKKAFSSESDLLRKTASLSKRIESVANEYIYAQLTGSGLRLNITL